MIKVSIVNQSTLFSDADLKVLANALQIQVSRDFFPVWGVSAQLFYTPKGSHPTADHWAIGIFDDPDQADALGYHDVTNAGLPLGKVFVRPTLAQGSAVESTASHELLEMLGDPDINLTVEVDDASGSPSKLYAYEVCDSPEADEFGYLIETDGKKVPMSDFVTPAWFETFRTAGPFDFMGKISKPFEILAGGYIGFLDLGNLSAGWQQEFARVADHSMVPPRMGLASRPAAELARQLTLARPRPGSRRSRRALPRRQWLASEYPSASESESESAAQPNL